MTKPTKKPAKTATKKTATKKTAPPPETVLVLRTCNADMTAKYNGIFKWPESGHVEAPDWNADAHCGHGLHGFVWGVGDATLADWSENAKWLVVEVPKATIVDLNGKVKFPRGNVIYAGDRLGATALVQSRAPVGTVCMGGTATAGYRGTATAGYGGTATAGYGGTMCFRWWDGNRSRIAVFYVGEDGIKPNVKYRCENGKAVKV